MRYLRASALACGLSLPFAAHASAEPAEHDRAYQEGIADYARGDTDAALASFRAVLLREPRNRSAQAAVRRLEFEAAARRTARVSGNLESAEPAGAVERFFLVSLPRWFYFERTIGDGLRDAGTLAAVNARAVQLLGERKVAFDRNCRFKNERQLRELIRRAPVATLGHGQA